MIACRLFGAKLLSEPMLTYYVMDPEERTSVKFEWQHDNFIQENEFEIVVWENGAILSWPHCVNRMSAGFLVISGLVFSW